MRFLLLTFAATAVGLACQKDPALSKSTSNLAPAPAVDPSGAGPRIAAPPAVVAPTAVAAEAPIEAAAEQQPTKPVSGADEGNGEPMDDVDDDEAVPATDKSGVDEPVDDDTDGVGIDIRQ
jgi:hypothetical protein